MPYLKHQSMPQTADLTVTACVLSLASNVEPTTHLALAKRLLQTFGKTTFSAISLGSNGEDSQIMSYHNQAAYIAFDTPLNYYELVKLTKAIERQGDRHLFAKPLVTLDVDIIAVKYLKISIKGLKDEKGACFIPFNNSLSHWLGIARRWPLASYDKEGLSDLARHTDLTFINDFLR